MNHNDHLTHTRTKFNIFQVYIGLNGQKLMYENKNMHYNLDQSLMYNMM